MASTAAERALEHKIFELNNTDIDYDTLCDFPTQMLQSYIADKICQFHHSLALKQFG